MKFPSLLAGIALLTIPAIAQTQTRDRPIADATTIVPRSAIVYGPTGINATDVTETNGLPVRCISGCGGGGGTGGGGDPSSTGTPGGAAPTTVSTIGGYDGAAVRRMLTDNGGRQIVNVNTLPAISGAVSVTNLPATQTVAGAVSVTNLPATQAVSGTVGVNNFPATQTIAGSVSISNFPTLQTTADAVDSTGTSRRLLVGTNGVIAAPIAGTANSTGTVTAIAANTSTTVCPVTTNPVVYEVQIYGTGAVLLGLDGQALTSTTPAAGAGAYMMMPTQYTLYTGPVARTNAITAFTATAQTIVCNIITRQ